MSTEDEIVRQLDQSQPVQINPEGEIVPANETKIGPEGEVVDSEERPVTQLKPTRWCAWYDSNPGRLLQEQQAMATRFPAFSLFNLTQGLGWVGYLAPQGDSGQSYRVAIIYPEDYPYGPPKVFVIEPKVRSTKHQYGDDSLCLMYPGDRTWQTNTTTVQIASMAATWLFCYAYHEQHCPTKCSDVPCRYWPGAEAQH